MSNEEKKSVSPITPNSVKEWWARGKKIVLLWEIGKVIIVVGGVLLGQALIMENKIVEVLATPQRATILEKKDSVQFAKTDSSLMKHNGFFTVIFKHVDTTK